ncbi:MAG TPA: DJ-1/PfpI family protein [Planctomycetes bacterium]|nr:DJ-1/PfpI family protein [Planctomycetota bacterium]
MTTPRALIPLAPGFEEIEAVTIVDVLRRGGVDVVTAALAPGLVEGAHGVRMEADRRLGDLVEESFDAVVLPGGMPGAVHLRDDELVQTTLKRLAHDGAITAAICAAPIALSRAGITAGHRVTSYPSFQGEIEAEEYTDEPVVVDGQVVTSRGPATALRFALSLVSLLVSEEKASELAESMLL